MLYNYTTKDQQGKTVIGTVEASSEKAAVDTLTDQNLVVVSLVEQKEVEPLLARIKFFERIPKKEIIILSRQLSTMVSAMVPIIQALRILVKQTTNSRLKVIVSAITDEIDGGAKLSTALAKYPEVFDNFYVNMVKSGEASGKLDDVLSYLADQQEKDYDLMNKIKGAMTYPAFISVGLVIVAIVMMTFVVPKLTGILKEAGVKLPLATRILIFISDFFVHWWWFLFLLALGAIILINFYRRTKQGKYIIDLLKLKIPIIGPIFQKIYLVRFSRSLETLIVGGVPLTIALKIISELIGNTIYEDLVSKTIKEVEEGESIAKVFSQSKEIPSMVSQMLTIGEKTGRLDEILGKLGNFYAREVEMVTQNLVTILEPLIIVAMGIAVGIMVAAIILPMYNIAAGF